MGKEGKTNAMRILSQKGIPFQIHSYPPDEGADLGVRVASLLGEPVEQVFKTLVTVGRSGSFYVFVIPAAGALDLKAAAKVVKEKALGLIPVKDIFSVTGYVRGGCSPIGMKKSYPVIIDESCLLFQTVMVSGGRPGLQTELSPADLIRAAGAVTAAVCTGTEKTEA